MSKNTDTNELETEYYEESQAKKMVSSIIITLLILGLIAFLTFYLVKQGQTPEPYHNNQELTDQAIATLKDKKTNKPKVYDSTYGIPVGKDLKVGIVNENKPKMEIFSDFICPACGTFERENSAKYFEQAKNGELTLVLHPINVLPNSSTDQYSERSANIAWYVATFDPEHFIPFYQNLYKADFQPKENSGYIPVTNEQLLRLAIDSGVNPNILVDTKKVFEFYKVWVKGVSDYAINEPRFDLSVTPRILIDGVVIENFTVDNIDAEIAKHR